MGNPNQKSLLVALLLLLPAGLRAQYRYTTINGAITVTGFTGSPTTITIPPSINSVPVIAILDHAFSGCSTLTSVSIPYSVTSIGAFAFAQCNSLTSISVNGSNPLYASINGALFNKSGSQLIQYPGGVNGNYAIPGSVASIGSDAFFLCGRLTGVTIPTSVASIGDSAFYASGLTNVVVPASITSIGDYAFAKCASLLGISVDAASTNYSGAGGVLFNRSGTLLMQYPGGLVGSYAIPNGVTSIANYYPFEYCAGLTRVTIPNTVTNIGTNGFIFCSGLTNVFFQGNAPSVGTSVFTGDNVTTAYYLPGTAGWANFAAATGLAPALWDAQAQTGDGGFGVRTNRFGFNITGNSSLVVVVEVSTNLATWSPVSTNALTTGTAYFNDPQGTNYPRRYYRLRSP